jgi:hypothetical protein
MKVQRGEDASVSRALTLVAMTCDSGAVLSDAASCFVNFAEAFVSASHSAKEGRPRGPSRRTIPITHDCEHFSDICKLGVDNIGDQPAVESVTYQ